MEGDHESQSLGEAGEGLHVCLASGCVRVQQVEERRI